MLSTLRAPVSLAGKPADRVWFAHESLVQCPVCLYQFDPRRPADRWACGEHLLTVCCPQCGCTFQVVVEVDMTYTSPEPVRHAPPQVIALRVCVDV